MIDGLGFCVLYRARVHPDKEAQYIAAWSQLTRQLREHGSLGSRLHRGNDGLWYAYAQWPSAQARTAAFASPAIDAQARAQMADAIAEFFPEIELDPVEDHLVAPAATSRGT